MAGAGLAETVYGALRCRCTRAAVKHAAHLRDAMANQDERAKAVVRVRVVCIELQHLFVRNLRLVQLVLLVQMSRLHCTSRSEPADSCDVAVAAGATSRHPRAAAGRSMHDQSSCRAFARLPLHEVRWRVQGKQICTNSCGRHQAIRRTFRKWRRRCKHTRKERILTSSSLRFTSICLAMCCRACGRRACASWMLPAKCPRETARDAPRPHARTSRHFHRRS